MYSVSLQGPLQAPLDSPAQAAALECVSGRTIAVKSVRPDHRGGAEHEHQDPAEKRSGLCRWRSW